MPKTIKMDQNWKDKKILIAEDSEINYILIKKNLEPSGASIIWVKNGRELIDSFEKDKDIDLILLDISMPKIDGFAATKMLREAGIKTPILAQSSFVFDSEIEKIFEAGCNDYISKPFRKEELIAKISALLQ
jgi:two-component system, cell cycle response regulator DivK